MFYLLPASQRQDENKLLNLEAGRKRIKLEENRLSTQQKKIMKEKSIVFGEIESNKKKRKTNVYRRLFLSTFSRSFNSGGSLSFSFSLLLSIVFLFLLTP